MLLAYPNVSEGRDRQVIDGIVSGFGPGVLDVHRDPDHHRTAITLAGPPGRLADAMLDGAAATIRAVSLDGHDGVHPRVGALDVAPVVWTCEADRGAACAEALVLADRLADELAIPVLLYGELAGGRTRAELRRGGLAGLAGRIAGGELSPDFGPRRPHPAAGVTLVAARPPLVAFNVVLAPPAGLAEARAVAARIREGGPDGLAATRALGLWLAGRERAQVSTNLDDPAVTTPADVVAAVAAHAEVQEAELVGLAPAAALVGFPRAVVLRGRATIEDRLAARGLGDRLS